MSNVLHRKYLAQILENHFRTPDFHIQIGQYKDLPDKHSDYVAGRFLWPGTEDHMKKQTWIDQESGVALVEFDSRYLGGWPVNQMVLITAQSPGKTNMDSLKYF